ncbi:TspO/MBR family protein [Propionivibrio sp.]|uniref:TspO/MBR family protein n=1 Tax=Propionivibrio sp. TaxID=2212460 RepID=UPI00345C3E4C
MGIALAEILLLLVAIGVNAVLFWRTDRLAGWLLIPYAAWVAFACLLNFALGGSTEVKPRQDRAKARLCRFKNIGSPRWRDFAAGPWGQGIISNSR